MPACFSTLPLDWSALCARVRRRHLPDHRGELPARGSDAVSLDAPVGIAACAQFGVRHRFTTEREAETWRWIGPRALSVCHRWHALRFDREEVRVALTVVRHGGANATQRQADAALADLRRRWTHYRRGMHVFTRQLDGVRHALTPRQPSSADVVIPALQAAE